MSDAEPLAWLRLARTETVGPVAFQHLLRRYGSAAAALNAVPALARRAGRTQTPVIYSRDEAEAEIAQGEADGARLLVSCDAAFPASLRAIDPPPPVLWALGDARLLHRRAVAVVGARIASASGRRFARDIALGLGEAGLVIASGLARGIDAAAHEGALATGTVAVLGGGIGDIYPPENEALYAAIAERGCVVSESQPRRAPKPRTSHVATG